MFCCENDLSCWYIRWKFKNWIDLLMIAEVSNSHYVCIKDFDRYMCNKTKNRNKKHFCKYWLKYFSSERVLVKHGVVCWNMNDKQTAKLKSGSIKFKN